jgi:hypothetical protein
MTARGIRELDLAPAIEFTEGHGHRQREASGVEAEFQLGGELLGEEETAGHPGLLPSQEFRDRRRAHAVLVHERGDHPRLVHGARGLPPGVGLEEPALQHDPARRLDDHRDLPPALRGPSGQPLESVDDLVVVVAGLRHPQGKRSEVHLTVGPTPPERGQAGAQAGDRDEADYGHRRTSSKGRTW